MKKLKIILTSLLCICFISIALTPTYAEENPFIHTKEVKKAPREILRSSYTTTIRYGAKYKARIKLNYTYRYEKSNASGKYITGFTSASITNVSGWYSVGSVSVKTNSISYSQNCQVAVVPITYTASIGAGNNTYNATIIVSLV